MRAESQKSLDLLRKMLASPEQLQDLRKAWTQPASAISGLQQYNLEGPSKKLFPVITPFRNIIPRYKVTGGNAINWRAVTGINTGNTSPGVSEGNRNSFISTTTSDFTRKFAGLGHEDYVTFEAGYAGEGFEDIRALAMDNCLKALMISEEFMILGGNANLALGTPAAPTGVAVAGGAMSARNPLVCRVVALTLEGLRIAGTSAPPAAGTISRTNADGSVDVINAGTSIRSAESAGVNVALNNKTTWNVAAVRGAYAYMWFTGLTGATKYAGTTTINQFVQTADEAGGAQDTSQFTADNSKNGLVFDGFLSYLADPAQNAYWKSLDGAVLTANNDGSIAQIDAALRDRWDNYRLTVAELWVSAQELVNITNKVTAGGTATAFRITIPSGGAQVAGITAGSIVGEYISKFNMEGGRSIPVRLHPNIPAGTVIGMTYSLPYPVNNVSTIWRLAVRQEYYGQDWPLKARKYEHGVYTDETLQCYAPFACFVITNVGNG